MRVNIIFAAMVWSTLRKKYNFSYLSEVCKLAQRFSRGTVEDKMSIMGKNANRGIANFSQSAL